MPPSMTTSMPVMYELSSQARNSARFATLPSPLYGLYRERDGLSTFTITIVYAIWAAGTIAALIAVPFIAKRIGRRGVMLAAVATMMVAAGELAAWKALPGLLLGRLLTGFAVGMAAGTAITYLIELRLRADPNASPAIARTIGTAVNVGEVERRLCENPQYAYARRLGQLKALRLLPVQGLFEQYAKVQMERGARLGDIKPVALWLEDRLKPVSTEGSCDMPAVGTGFSLSLE